MERVCTLVVLVILIPCFTIQGQEQQAALCPSGWFEERSSCYKLSKNVLNWQAAKNACEDLNSTLAIISSLAEHQALKSHIYRIRKNTWIGLHRDPRVQNGWLWVDGSRLNDSYWGESEPNNIDEECVEMRLFYPHYGRWNDQECSDTINYICEKDVNECASNPCKNGATCANTIERFNCTCTKGFQGKICNKVVIKQSQVSPYSSTSLTAKSPPNINHLPATSSLFHPKVMVSSSAHQPFPSSSSVQIKVAIKPSQVSPGSSKSLATQDTPVRILTSSNDIYFPATSSLFHTSTVSSSVQPTAFPSSSVQMEVVIKPRQVSPYSSTPLTTAQHPQMRILLPPTLDNHKVTVSSSAHQSFPSSSSVQIKVAIKPSQVSPGSSKSLATQDTPIRILTSSNDIHFPATSSLFHEGTVSSSVQPSAFPSSPVQMEVVITPRQVSPYSFTPLTAAQSPQVRTLLPPTLHNYKVTVSSSAHQSFPSSSSVQIKVATKPSQVSPCSSKSLATEDTPVRILPSSNDIHFPATSSVFHEGTVSSSVQPSAFPSSPVQMEVVIKSRQVSPYSSTPLKAAQSQPVHILPSPTLDNHKVTVSSSAHQSAFPSSSVQMKALKCPSQLSHGVSWETTPRGNTDKKPCPNGAEGTAKRKCSYDGTWENANFLNCRSAEYSKLVTQMNAIASGSSNLTVPQVLAQLKNATKPIINSPERPSQIYGRDLIAAVEILAQIAEYSKHRNVSSKEDFQNIAQVASNLLEPVNSRTWVALDKAHKNKSLVLLSTLDSYGMEVPLSCEMSGKPNSVEAKNLLMMIEDRNCSVSRSRGNGSYISYSNTTIYLPPTVFISSPNSRAVTVIYLTLNDILALPKENADEDDKRILADTTIVSTVVRPKPPAVLRDPVKIVLKNRKVNTTSRKRCVFWRPDEQAIWGTSGCTLVPSESNASFTTCKCNHLTIFAALVDPYGRPEKGSHKEALEIISIVGCSISLVAVILTIILLSCFSRPLEAGVKVLINLCAAIAITCVLAIFEGLARRKAVCPVVAGLLHYFALALFSWMLCEGILHYLKVVKPLKYGFAVDDYVKYFYMCGWGFPAIIVSISLAVTQANGYGSKATCWLDVKSGLIWTFIGPTLVVILINCVVLYLVMRKIMKPVKGKVEEKTQITKLRAGVRVSMAILPLVGITWVFGILSFSSYTIAFKYIFAIFNSLQGLMIFIFHCALNGKIKQAIRKRMYRFKRGKLNHNLKVKEEGGNLLTNFTRKRSKCNEHECEVLPIRRDNVELNTLKDREDESLKTEDESLKISLLSNSNE